MPNSRSFKEYVSNRFYNELFDAVAEYISDNTDDLDLRLYRIRRSGEIELEDIYVRTVSVNDLPGSAVSFDIALEAELCVHEADYHYDETEGCRQWFMLRCHGDLACSLDDFAIDNVGIYSGKNRQRNPLDDSLVPVIGNDDLETRATEFLKKHYPKALLQPMYVDPTELAAGMGLDVKLRHITGDCSVFGQIFFTDCKAEFYDKDSEEQVIEDVKAKTIVVDPDTYFFYNLGKVNNTIVHECVHWDLHRKAYELERLYNSEACQIRCRAVGGVEGNSKTATEWMEWQANALTPRIQMPLTMFKRQASKYIKEIRQQSGKFDLIDIIEPVIESLAVFFGVSKLAAKIRMLDAGFEEAAGAFIYVDGHRVRPCIAQKGRVGINQTFTISGQDAAIQRAINPELRELTKNGDYLFVENHYVYNTPLYVEYNEDGELALTYYARTHMDECCIPFDISIKSDIQADYHSICYLNREESDITFDVNFHNGWQNATPQRQIERRQKDLDEQIEIRKQMTDDPEKCMKVLLEWREMSYTQLGKEIGRDPKTIQRTVKGATTPTLETAVLICFALHLPPLLSERLLDALGCKFNPMNKDHQWIREALYLKYPESLNAVKRYLWHYGVDLR